MFVQTPKWRREYKARPGVAERLRVYQREWKRKAAATNPAYAEKSRIRARAHYWKMADDPARWPVLACRTVKRRALAEGVPFDLTPVDLTVPPLCPVFGVPFVFRGRNHPLNPSVDRIRGDRGYVQGNVRVICRRANVMKSDSQSSAEMLAVALYMEREGL